ncbi:MAG: YaeQ family protein [Pirellula sp.]
MGTKSTIYKAELTITDIDRQYYETHPLVIAQHPSEPDRRVMARLIVFAIFAHERLEFGRGISSDQDPDLWRRDLTGVIEQWIELGQPEESDIRKACGLSKEVIIVTYSGNSADVWWSKNVSSLTKQKNLKVLNIDAESLDQATRLLDRRMTLTALIQDGEFQLSNSIDNVTVISNLRK